MNYYKNSEYQREYYIKNRKKILEKHKEYNIKNKNKIALIQSSYKQRNLEKIIESNRKNHIKRTFKIEPYIIDELYKKINGKCMICFCDMILKTKKFNNMTVDHNHITGKVRGIICRRCNAALGGFLDNIDILKSAIKYLEKSNEK